MMRHACVYNYTCTLVVIRSYYLSNLYLRVGQLVGLWTRLIFAPFSHVYTNLCPCVDNFSKVFVIIDGEFVIHGYRNRIPLITSIRRKRPSLGIRLQPVLCQQVMAQHITHTYVYQGVQYF